MEPTQKPASVPKGTRKWTVCPYCSRDLVALEPVRVGDLYHDPVGETYWKGQKVHLSPSERLILTALANAGGQVTRRTHEPCYAISASALAERADISVESLPVLMSNLRKSFRLLDPEFNMIETEKGSGYRWATINPSTILISQVGPRLTVFKNGECVWREKFRLKLSPWETRALVMLMEARGEIVSVEKLATLSGSGKFHTGHRVIELLRTKFKQVDPEIPIIMTAPRGKASYSIYRSSVT